MLDSKMCSDIPHLTPSVVNMEETAVAEAAWSVGLD